MVFLCFYFHAQIKSKSLCARCWYKWSWLLFSNSLRSNENNLIYFRKQLGNKGKREFSASRAVLSRYLRVGAMGEYHDVKFFETDNNYSRLSSIYLPFSLFDFHFPWRKGLHLNPKGKGRLALNFMKQIRKFWRSLEHLNESFLPFDLSEKILRKSENLLSKPLNEENTYDIENLSIFETKIHTGLS